MLLLEHTLPWGLRDASGGDLFHCFDGLDRTDHRPDGPLRLFQEQAVRVVAVLSLSFSLPRFGEKPNMWSPKGRRHDTGLASPHGFNAPLVKNPPTLKSINYQMLGHFIGLAKCLVVRLWEVLCKALRVEVVESRFGDLDRYGAVGDAKASLASHDPGRPGIIRPFNDKVLYPWKRKA
ncbi:hypothetical protein [Pseudomonas putida]|uniref:hypothetical protein n=1 Tax=Pseudomonas TaxID=286 RepID=UPI003466FAFF